MPQSPASGQVIPATLPSKPLTRFSQSTICMKLKVELDTRLISESGQLPMTTVMQPDDRTARFLKIALGASSQIMIFLPSQHSAVTFERSSLCLSQGTDERNTLPLAHPSQSTVSKRPRLRFRRS